MTREEILAKSRSENKETDERERSVELRAGNIASAVGLALSMLVVFINDVLGGAPAVGMAAFLIYWGTYSVNYWYKAVKLKGRSNWAMAIGGTAFFVAFAAAFLALTLQWEWI